MNQTRAATKNLPKCKPSNNQIILCAPLQNIEQEQKTRTIWLAALTSSIANNSARDSAVALQNLSHLGPIDPEQLANPMSASLIHNNLKSVGHLLVLGADPNMRCSQSFGLHNSKDIDTTTAAGFSLLNALHGNISPYCYAIMQWDMELMWKFMTAGFSPHKALDETQIFLERSKIAQLTMRIYEERTKTTHQAYVASIEEALLDLRMTKSQTNQISNSQLPTIRAL